MAKRGRPRKTKKEELPKEEVNQEAEEVQPEEEEVVEAEPIEPVEEVSEEVEPTPESDSNVVGDGTFSDFNPLQESVIERDYSTPKVASGIVEDIDEPSFVPPSYEDLKTERENEGMEDEMGGGDGKEGGAFDNPNPAFNDLDRKDKKIACESLVDTALDAYEQLHKYAQYTIKVDEDELMIKHQQGKIDLTEQIPVSETGDTMTIQEFIGQFNEQSVQALSYDKEFGYKVRPAMIRVFMKRGWGMTDEQYLMYMFGKDIAVKVGIMWQLKKTISTTIAQLEKAHKQNQGGRTTPPPPMEEDYEDVFEEEEEERYEEPDLEMYEDEKEADIIIEDDIPKQKENFSQSMDINMPQNPKDPLAEHPEEIKEQLKSSKKKK